ncbi:hypothetical protein NUW58_g5687 [Xylaria curta]|uniref:Uncharacterized protein n=1 Tax=Xylaria curta TaxID=42375 RepID=A0ACC1P2N0_9PEZI|nr:hypothetical protein NUW58_g5687 [Xylaria curta]
MSQVTGQNMVAAGEVTVETNNFYRVQEYFDASGDLRNKETRFEIECQICLVKNLGIVNPRHEQPTLESHEDFIVLPRCGHAFGYRCIADWVYASKRAGLFPSCPTCRISIGCPWRHKIPAGVYGFPRRLVENQARDILAIRALILKWSCADCVRERQELAERAARQLPAQRILEQPQQIAGGEFIAPQRLEEPPQAEIAAQPQREIQEFQRQIEDGQIIAIRLDPSIVPNGVYYTYNPNAQRAGRG